MVKKTNIEIDDKELDLGDVEVDEYDIISSPNDWNCTTIVDYINRGVIKFPSFQRNYVWDKKRASKLIESLIKGLPVPQIYIYESEKNLFQVIDGQQRLLSLYFFYKGRIPRPKARGSLRTDLTEKGNIGDDLINNDEIFEDFALSLPKMPGGEKNALDGMGYSDLGETALKLDLSTIRCIVVKQISPRNDSAMYEIFSRLNSGGQNLNNQEIRASLYYSDFYRKVVELNLNPTWRSLLNMPYPEARMKDVEFLLRSFALAYSESPISGSMSNYINKFCQIAKSFTEDRTAEIISSMEKYLGLFDGIDYVFIRDNKFSGLLFESSYVAWVKCGRPEFSAEELARRVRKAGESQEFAETLQEGTTKAINMAKRISVLERELI